MRGSIGQIELAVGVDAFVLRIGQMRAGRAYHAVELGSSRRLKLELADPHEIIEFLFAHIRISSSAPKIKIFGSAPIVLRKEPLREALRRHSAGEKKIGLTLRCKAVSAFCKAA